MADDFLTKDRADADVDLAAKETATGKLTPRSLLTKDDGTTDINPATEEKQDAGNASLVSLVSALVDPATEATLAGLLTDAQLRATDLPVSGTFWQATQPVSFTWAGLTDTELRASAVPVSAASLPASLGPKAGASSLSVVESTPTTVTIVSLQTNATGTTYNAFASQACEQLDIVNTASGAVDLEVRRGGSGNTIIVPGGSSRMFIGITNASDLQVRRRDVSNTQVTFTSEAIKA